MAPPSTPKPVRFKCDGCGKRFWDDSPAHYCHRCDRGKRYAEGYKHGADTIWNAKNAEGLTPIEAAKKSGREEAAKYIEGYACDICSEEVESAIAVMVAAIREKIK